MTAPVRLPRISRWILTRASRLLRADEMADDARELFVQYSLSHGRRHAARWYRAQARAALWRLLAGGAARFVPATGWFALTGLSLDARLGFRMLRRYPGLTLVGGLAMAFAIFVGSVLFEFINQTLPNRDLPIAHGERVVGLRHWDRSANVPTPPSAADLHYWRTHLTSVEMVGGFSTVTQHVETAAGTFSSEQIALMSPSGFSLVGTAPALGRVFTDEDVASGLTSVAVISHATWQALFAGASEALGQRIRVGGNDVTIIGVMPEGFRFPVSHSLWIPLDTRVEQVHGLRGFGRLRADVSLEQAQQEIVALTAGAVRQEPVIEHVAPLVQWYRESLFDMPVTLLWRLIIQQLNTFAALFMLLVAANIALLMFARAATRERELVVRSALGASRRRIVTQFLIEALALFGIATTIGLVATGPGLAWIDRRIGDMGGGTSPFWFSPTVSIDTVIYASLLTVAAALLAGGLPALRATRQLSASRIQETSGGAGRLRLGGIWSAVVVAQVAATVVFTAGAALMWRQAELSGTIDAGFPASEYVAVQVEARDGEGSPARLARLESLVSALSKQPGIAGATVAERLPLMTHAPLDVEVEGLGRHEVSMPMVGPGFFDLFQVPIVSGRSFSAADLRPRSNVVIVDQSFAQAVFGAQNAVGRRVRVASASANAENNEPGPWMDIIGVTRSLETNRPGRLYLDNQNRPFVYQPFDPSQMPAFAYVAVHAPPLGNSALMSVRKAAATHDATLTVHEVQTLDRVVRSEAAFWQLWAQLVLVASVVAFLLALAGIYAVMSFTVTRRTREIGIRMALGARGVRVALGVLRGPMQQVAGGILAGCMVLVGLFWSVTRVVTEVELGALAAFGLCIAGVCSLACLGPARRALSVQPTDSLRAGD